MRVRLAAAIAAMISAFMRTLNYRSVDAAANDFFAEAEAKRRP
jgi:hypothetical protein